MKRLYTTVSTNHCPQSWAVLLDKNPVLTPLGKLLLIPSVGLADAIRGEWANQKETINPLSMPLTQLACTALDKTSSTPGIVIDAILSYASSDLVCYRNESPADLNHEQDKLWQPLLDWFHTTYGVKLNATTNLQHTPLSDQNKRELQQHLSKMNAWALTGLHEAVAISSSLVIGLALLEGHISTDQAFNAAFLEELYQARRWGDDPDALSRRHSIRQDLRATEQFLRLVYPSSHEGKAKCP